MLASVLGGEHMNTWTLEDSYAACQDGYLLAYNPGTGFIELLITNKDQPNPRGKMEQLSLRVDTDPVAAKAIVILTGQMMANPHVQFNYAPK